MIEITENQDSIIFNVRVIPRSSKSEIVGEHDGDLKVKLSSPPVDGKANKELIKILSKELKIAKSNIEIISGETSKTKQIKIRTSDKQIIYAILQAKK
ncbi:MAG: DUF167 domain-containing protein [Acidobacteriota bacterium]|nr:DUF167 domain-containing protein [Acidobacteriota bacterium]